MFINSWSWQDIDIVGSTNDVIKKSKDKGRQIVSAKKQINGRGRRGRSWESLLGNLFVSFGMELDINLLGQVIMIVGLSLQETIKSISDGSQSVLLKWPNDVLLNNKKVSGILLERSDQDYLVIGIGVNTEKSPKIDGLIYPATSLKEEGIEIDRLSFLKLYVDFFDNNLNIWEKLGFEDIKERWLANVKDLNQKIEIREDSGIKSGKFVGIDDNGFLLIENNGTVERIMAGDVL